MSIPFAPLYRSTRVGPSMAVLSLLVLLALPAIVGAAARSRPDDDYFIPGTDLADSLQRAQRGGQAGVVVLFEMEGCGECAKLRADTLQAPPLRDYFQAHFVTVSLHADTDLPLHEFAGRPTTATAFAHSEGVVALPTVVLYDRDGAPVARQVGRAADLALWLRLGRYVVEHGYEDAPFAAWQPGNDAADQ